MTRVLVPTNRERATILLVDHHPSAREWLANLINREFDLQICGEASGRLEALKLLADLKPEVVIVDLSLEEGSGIELIKDIKAAAPSVAVIALSVYDQTADIERALHAGARGSIMKSEATKKVLTAIRAVLDGNLFLSEKVALMLAEKAVGQRPSPRGSLAEVLSNRELQVFRLLGCGRTNRQISEELHVALGTVQEFCKRIKEKLQLNNANELLREAVRWNDRHFSQ